ncbi:MAG: signal peptidase I [Ruminococcaceae bacterium]|nr:signal peptidase I [Oscillospiraceae bacterium]
MTAMNNKNFTSGVSDATVFKAELARIKHRQKYKRVLKSTVFTLIVVAAVAVLVATLWMPVLQIYGTSMTPSLHDGDIIISVKDTEPETGDIIAFYYNNKILVKRVIAGPGEWIDIDGEGNVFVNSVPISEPYLSEKALGECNIEFPYQVPEAKYFVLGDHRSVSTDSRNTAVGCVSEEQMVGRIVFRVWPLSAFGKAD